MFTLTVSYIKLIHDCNLCIIFEGFIIKQITLLINKAVTGWFKHTEDTKTDMITKE